MRGRRRLRIFVLIDALGWRCLQGRQFLSDVLPYRRPLRTILGFSSGAIPTLLTGRLPSETGHWNLYYYDPVGSPFRWLRHFGFLPDPILRHRVTRKVLKELGRRVLGLGPLFECAVSPRYLPWFNWTEKRNIYEPGGISQATSIFDVLSRSGTPHRVYTYHQAQDAELLRRATRDVEESEATFFFLYLSELDGFLHAHRTAEERITERLTWYDGELRALLARASTVDPDAQFAVMSDHGMAAVQHHVDLVTEVERLGLTMPDDYLAVYDSTMARFWFFSDRARAAVPAALAAITSGRVLSEAELREFGIWFPDRRFGELIFLLDPAWLFSRSDFNDAAWNPRGMHGYHPDDADSDAIFLSNWIPRIEPKTIADLYGCMTDAGAADIETRKGTAR
jgi:hypothetical protein